MTVMPIVVGTPEKLPKGGKDGGTGNKKKNRDHPDIKNS